MWPCKTSLPELWPVCAPHSVRGATALQVLAGCRGWEFFLQCSVTSIPH